MDNHLKLLLNSINLKDKKQVQYLWEHPFLKKEYALKKALLNYLDSEQVKYLLDKSCQSKQILNQKLILELYPEFESMHKRKTKHYNQRFKQYFKPETLPKKESLIMLNHQIQEGKIVEFKNIKYQNIKSLNEKLKLLLSQRKKTQFHLQLDDLIFFLNKHPFIQNNEQSYALEIVSIFIHYFKTYNINYTTIITQQMSPLLYQKIINSLAPTHSLLYEIANQKYKYHFKEFNQLEYQLLQFKDIESISHFFIKKINKTFLEAIRKNTIKKSNNNKTLFKRKNKLNIHVFSLVYLLNSLKLNQNQIANIIENTNYYPVIKKYTNIKQYLQNYSPYKLYQLFLKTNNYDFFEDLEYQLNDMPSVKFKSLEELYLISGEYQSQKTQSNHRFQYPAWITKIRNIDLPQNNYELIKQAKSMNICAGNGRYAKKILAHSSYIAFYTYRKNTYCVEFNKSHVLQIKSKNNISPKKEIKTAIKKHFHPFK